MEDKNLNQGLRETADELPGSDCGELSDEEADAVAGGRGASAVRGTSAARSWPPHVYYICSSCDRSVSGSDGPVWRCPKCGGSMYQWVD